MRYSIRDLFFATTLLAVFVFGFTLLLQKDEWGPAPRLPVFFVAVMAGGAGVAAPFKRKLIGMSAGAAIGLVYFSYELHKIGIGQFLSKF